MIETGNGLEQKLTAFKDRDTEVMEDIKSNRAISIADFFRFEENL